MTPQQIKGRLIERAGSLSGVAAALNEDLKQVSATIHYAKLNQRIRAKLQKAFGVRFSPRIPIRINQQRQARRAA